MADPGLFVPPYLSIRRTGDGLQLGTMPPLAYLVDDAPPFLGDLLAGLSAPADRAEIVARVEAAAPDWSAEDAESLVEDLESIGVLVPAFDASDRYARHRLYYRMLGVPDDPQHVLQSKTVGLIGMGGIGTHLALHLAAAGVGHIVATDGDVVEESNLTRQTIFSEQDIGRFKVDAAAEHLRALRSDLRVTTIRSGFTGPELAREVASQCDVVLLSADRPASVHTWVNGACLAAGVPFSAAGYIESFGSVGPWLAPPATPCFDCIATSANALASQALDADQIELSSVEVNPRFQAPSYGPLNAWVAAIQANEAIRALLGLPVATQVRRLLVDSQTYAVTWEDFEATATCATCGRGAEKSEPWTQIAAQYESDRDDRSFNSVVLDPLIPEILPVVRGRRVADVGAGAGQTSAWLAAEGALVDAYEPFEQMRSLAVERLHDVPNVRVLAAGVEGLEAQPPYDLVLCLNVLDHVAELPDAMGTLASAVAPGGTLILSVPHPMKDRGGWKKVAAGPEHWTYQHFQVDDYFDEGPVVKDREDHRGEVVVTGVTSFHRTTATYLGAVVDAGLTIRRVLEPKPAETDAGAGDLIHEKASRIPYFLVIVADRADG